MLFVCYPKCTTCQKAKAFLDERGVSYEARDIKLENPTAEELRGWWEKSGMPLKKFFNTSGLQYKALGLKDKLPEMSEEEQLALLATDGMLVKRPILVGGTGLWLDAVVQGRTFAGGHAGGAVRRELQAQLAAQGVTIVSEKGFKWPSYATTITSLFGSRTHPVTGRPNNHTGVDIAAAGGTDIWAAKSGVVLTSTYNSSYGNYVVISHANGESTLYAHMSKRLVSEGDKVTQGQTIGLVGTTGSSTGNHLHFEVRLNGQRQDPLNYFRGSTFTLRASGKSVSYTVS